MISTPTIDIQEIRSALTDAGHTAVGFATMAAKKANDVRLDFNERYEGSIADFRKQALVAVRRVESVRSDVEARVEPVVAKVVERFPEPAQKLITDATDAAKGFQTRSYDFVVKTLTVEAPVAKADAATAKTATATKRAGTAATKKSAPTAKAAAARPNARKAPAAKTTAAKTTARKSTAAKASAVR